MSVTQPAHQTVHDQSHTIQVWDAPLRLFHWSLLAAVATAITTGLLGGDWMPWHGRAGIAALGLVAFRLVWGLIGSGTARFSQFLPTPARLKAYLSGHWHGVGHNPLGALSVVALLAFVAAQVITGLFSNDDIAFAGPFSSLVDEDLVHALTAWHHRLINVLYGLIALHLLAIAFYTVVKKERLVPPMITGKKTGPIKQAPPHRARPWAWLVAVAAGLSVSWVANGSWAQASAHPDVPAAPSATAASAAASTAPTPSW